VADPLIAEIFIARYASQSLKMKPMDWLTAILRQQGVKNGVLTKGLVWVTLEKPSTGKFGGHILGISVYESRQQIAAAFRHGEIKRQPCIICGRPYARAHHWDYSRPLDVVWYCNKHHMALHHNLSLAGIVLTKEHAKYPLDGWQDWPVSDPPK